MSNLATITNNILADSGIDDINVIVSTGSYANPSWITSLAWTKITGAPSNIVTGTGTTNVVPKFTGTSTIGDSAISDTTTEVNITKRVFITSGVNQFVFTPNLGSTSNRIETLGGLPLEITTSGSSIGMNVGGGSSQFSMTNTGASFFIPVTSNGQAATSPAFIANNSTGTSGTAQHYINFTAGTTTIARMLRGNGAAGLVANGLNIDNFDGFQVRLNQLGGSGGSFNITGGNVGIGTTSPTFRLDVQNNTQAVARVLDTSTNASLILQAGSGSAMKVTAYNYASSTALPLYIQVDGANTIMQSGGGNLLVGTTTDNGARLQVSGGAVSFNNGSAQSSIIGTTFTGFEYTRGSTIFGFIGTENSASGGMRYNSVAGNFEHKFYNNSNLALTLSSTGAATFSSSVTAGAATVSSSGLLTIAVGNSVGGAVKVQDTDGGGTIEMQASGGLTYLGSTSNHNVSFIVNNSPVMLLNTSGNVGIGTNSPMGFGGFTNLTIGSTATNNQSAIFLVNSSVSIRGSWYQNAGTQINFGTATNHPLVFDTNDTERMRITSGGNVGIGTSSPTPHNGTNALVIQGGSGSRGIMEIWDNSGAGGKAVFQQVGGDTYLGSLAKGSGSGDLYLLVNGTGTSATISTTFKANGNVLIGTTTDNGARLQVSGNTYSEGLHIATGQIVQGASATNTFYTFSNTSINRVFLITLRQSGSSANNVVAIGFTFGGSLGAYNIIQDNTNPVLFLTISASGLGLRLTTGSGYGTTTWDWTITQLK